MLKNLFLIGFGIFGISKILGIKKTVDATENLQFKPKSVKWVNFSQGAFNLSVVFSIFNPVNKDINLSFLYSDIFIYNDTKLTNITFENWNKIIKKEGITDIVVPVKIYLTDILFLGWTLLKKLKGGILPKELNLKGYVKINGYTVPFDESVNVIK